eukprot:TRINITY_DN4332_c0_g1_i1.p1 TRINITY_DN4332_c0_g1~~TRINITY_DN4332_c0_g1_i1.p1  ORF type:complete len:820 (+),score=70.60 TRINITY_DN4332_c0_g1_i1:141-2600(+)
MGFLLIFITSICCLQLQTTDAQVILCDELCRAAWVDAHAEVRKSVHIACPSLDTDVAWDMELAESAANISRHVCGLSSAPTSTVSNGVVVQQNFSSDPTSSPLPIVGRWASAVGVYVFGTSGGPTSQINIDRCRPLQCDAVTMSGILGASVDRFACGACKHMTSSKYTLACVYQSVPAGDPFSRCTETSTRTPMPTVSPVPTSTWTPVPTVSPVPTSTWTPVPTVSPVPTSTRTPVPTVSVSQTGTGWPERPYPHARKVQKSAEALGSVLMMSGVECLVTDADDQIDFEGSKLEGISVYPPAAGLATGAFETFGRRMAFVAVVLVAAEVARLLVRAMVLVTAPYIVAAEARDAAATRRAVERDATRKNGILPPDGPDSGRRGRGAGRRARHISTPAVVRLRTWAHVVCRHAKRGMLRGLQVINLLASLINPVFPNFLSSIFVVFFPIVVEAAVPILVPLGTYAPQKPVDIALCFLAWVAVALPFLYAGVLFCTLRRRGVPRFVRFAKPRGIGYLRSIGQAKGAYVLSEEWERSLMRWYAPIKPSRWFCAPLFFLYPFAEALLIGLPVDCRYTWPAVSAMIIAEGLSYVALKPFVLFSEDKMNTVAKVLQGVAAILITVAIELNWGDDSAESEPVATAVFVLSMTGYTLPYVFEVVAAANAWRTSHSWAAVLTRWWRCSPPGHGPHAYPLEDNSGRVPLTSGTGAEPSQGGPDALCIPMSPMSPVITSPPPEETMPADDTPAVAAILAALVAAAAARRPGAAAALSAWRMAPSARRAHFAALVRPEHATTFVVWDAHARAGDVEPDSDDAEPEYTQFCDY